MLSAQVLVVLLSLSSVLAALPKGWKACKRSAKDYDACFIKEVTTAISTLVDGDKKLGSLPLDPLKIEKLEIPQHDGPVSISLLFTNLDIIGVKNLKIKSAKNDWKTVTAVVHVPNLSVIGDYKINGKVLVLPIQGQGPCNITFDDMNLDINVEWKQIDNGGKKYFQMKDFKLTLNPKKVYFQLDNLFNGDKALGDNMNVFLNENWEQILMELRPALTEGLSQALSQISNRILSKIPANEIDLK